MPKHEITMRIDTDRRNADGVPIFELVLPAAEFDVRDLGYLVGAGIGELSVVSTLFPALVHGNARAIDAFRDGARLGYINARRDDCASRLVIAKPL